MMEPLAEKRGIALTFPPFDTPSFVRADRTRLKQVLVNLLSNAIKYNLQGGAGRRRLAPTSPAEARPHQRERHRRGLAARRSSRSSSSPSTASGRKARAEEGTGIGLVMAKRLVELMGGMIGVESTVGLGQRVLVRAEVAPPRPNCRSTTRDPRRSAPPSACTRPPLRTLLYVEDNPANLQLVEQTHRAPARHPPADRGERRRVGIALARDRQPDVILMDINLPGISGTEALKMLREDPLTAHIPVVAISANAMPRDIRNGPGSGLLPLPHQADQGHRVHGCAGRRAGPWPTRNVESRTRAN